MKICLISVEIFAWGKYGGFGRSTRMIGRELSLRGIDVTAVVPRRGAQKPVEELDGIKVLGFEPANPFSAIELYRQADADIYHSQEPSFGTYLAQYVKPKRKHIITFRDTRNTKDWWIEFLYPSKNSLQVLSNILYENNFLVSRAVCQADALFSASKSIQDKAKKKYRLKKDVVFLPSPVPFSEKGEKSKSPLVIFLGRFDRRKRPHKFFDLAKEFPHVHFLAMGAGRDPVWQKELEEKYAKQKNLELLGFINQFDEDGLSKLLSEAWILINTSKREGLPTSFIEAAGHKCAILSNINADNFSEKFGYHVKDDDFRKGLAFLLENNRWQEKGKKGYAYVKNLFSVEKAMEKHIEIYEGLI